MRKITILMQLVLLSYFSNAQCDVDFGSTTGTFTFAYVSGTDIVNGASSGANDNSVQSFDIWNEGAAPLDCTVGAGANDITFEFDIVHAFDVYSVDGIIDAYAGSTHDIGQSTSGLRGTTPLGNSSANETTSGDVRGYQVKVTFANHVVITADEFTVNTTSVNTKGEAFESCAIVFLNELGAPYGTAVYEGYYGNGSAGPSTDASCTIPAAGTAWATTGTGVYTMQDPGTIDFDPLNLCNPVGGANGSDNNKDVAAICRIKCC